MSELNVRGSILGNALSDLLSCREIVPGDAPSYQVCKAILAYHPLGAKIAESPISMAMSQRREIAVAGAPDRVHEEFEKTWDSMRTDGYIFNLGRLARTYGISSIISVADGFPPSRPLDLAKVADLDLKFNVLDPLNTAGSLVLSQDPNSPDFQRPGIVSSNGIPYHRTRSVVLMNEDPLYIDFTTSAFGFVGRSSYQRILFPLKSFVQTMVTDDMVSKKAGLLIAKMKVNASIVDRLMASVSSIKRALLKEGETNNVLSIEVDEEIESLNLQNIDGAGGFARKNILENCASGADMPAKILNAETFAEGFGEGTEDAKYVAQFVERVRIWMKPAYDYFDPIVQMRAWTPDFFKTIQHDFPEDYGKIGYREALYRWRNAFVATWPSLLREPESELIKVEDVKLKAIIAFVQVLTPDLDPENRATLIQWACDNMNENKLLFQSPLNLNYEAIAEYEPIAVAEGGEDEGAEKPKTPRPFAATDSQPRDVKGAIEQLSAAIARLPSRPTVEDRRKALVAIDSVRRR